MLVEIKHCMTQVWISRNAFDLDFAFSAFPNGRSSAMLCNVPCVWRSDCQMSIESEGFWQLQP